MLACRRSILSIAIAAALTLGCDSNSSSEPTGFDLSGTWTGAATIPDSSTASIKVQQRVTSVTGALTINTRFPQGQALSGSVDIADRTFTWLVANGCEMWSGTLLVSSDARSMAGSLLIERDACPPEQAAIGSTSGTLSLTK
jgi:hypothetical protein